MKYSHQSNEDQQEVDGTMSTALTATDFQLQVDVEHTVTVVVLSLELKDFDYKSPKIKL